MDFDCEQRNNVHFFYVLPFSKIESLIETTWFSKNNDNSFKDYDLQIQNYLRIIFITLIMKLIIKKKEQYHYFILIIQMKIIKLILEQQGAMTRLSTGYTFLNIQEH